MISRNVKIALALSSVGLLTFGGLYLSGTDLQGKFELKTTPNSKITSSTSTESPVLAEVSAARDNEDIFLTTGYLVDDTAETYPVLPLANFDFTPVKQVDVLDRCYFSFGYYYDGDMYEMGDSSGTFLTSPSLSFTQEGKLKEEVSFSSYSTAESSKSDDLVGFLSDLSWGMKKNTAITLELSGKAPAESSTWSAIAGDFSSYDESSFDIYLTNIYCSYPSAAISSAQWDAKASDGENKYFKIPSAVKGKGLFMTHVTAGVVNNSSYDL